DLAEPDATCARAGARPRVSPSHVAGAQAEAGPDGAAHLRRQMRVPLSHASRVTSGVSPPLHRATGVVEAAWGTISARQPIRRVFDGSDDELIDEKRFMTTTASVGGRWRATRSPTRPSRAGSAGVSSSAGDRNDAADDPFLGADNRGADCSKPLES